VTTRIRGSTIIGTENRSKVDGRAEEDAKNSRINETRVELVVGRAASGFADERYSSDRGLSSTSSRNVRSSRNV